MIRLEIGKPLAENADLVLCGHRKPSGHIQILRNIRDEGPGICCFARLTFERHPARIKGLVRLGRSLGDRKGLTKHLQISLRQRL